MYRTLVVLCLVSTESVFALWEKSLKLRFDVNPFGIGSTSFMEMPDSVIGALTRGWSLVKGPATPAGYESLELWCPNDAYTICLLFDDTGYIAGVQIAFDQSRFASLFDSDILGFSNWTTTLNGNTTTYSTIRQYYISADSLATDKYSRLASRNPNTLLQDGNLFVTGFNGDLYNISTKVKDFTKGSIYTKQACLPWMGLHYYYNMSRSLPCQADTMFPWFPLVYSNQLIGVGFVVFGQYTLETGEKNYFENPGKLAVKVIVPRGPKCLYDLADSPGLVTMHTYFIKHPQLLSCIL